MDAGVFRQQVVDDLLEHGAEINRPRRCALVDLKAIAAALAGISDDVPLERNLPFVPRARSGQGQRPDAVEVATGAVCQR